MGHEYRDGDILYELYHEEGLTQAEIGDKFGVTDNTIRKYMKRNGIETRGNPQEEARKPLFDNEESELKRLYWVEDLNAAEIADRANVEVTDVTVLNRMREYGIERRNSAADRPPGVYVHPDEYPYVRHYDGESEHIVFTHQLLAVSEYGFEAVKNNDVHHTTGFKQDNRPEAIEVVSHSDHQREHSSNTEDSPIVIDDLSDAIS